MNILGKRPQREFFPGENESLSSELKSVLSKKVNCEIFSRQLLLAIKNDCSGRRFSKKHDQIQASFVLYHTFKKTS